MILVRISFTFGSYFVHFSLNLGSIRFILILIEFMIC